MKTSKSLSCDQAKQMDMVDYLAGLGYHPARRSNNDYWYLSPLRDEKNASFKINRKLNCWYDHGIGKGGNLVDFGVLYFNCSVTELLDKLSNNLSFHPPHRNVPAPEKTHPETQIKILSERSLTSIPLIRYLKQRRISPDVAKKYCREVHFELGNKQYTGLGFRNDGEGYEIRNQWFKGSTSPKGITTINNDAKELSVFEGFFNFLSYQTIYKNEPASHTDFLILNSAAFFEKSRHLMEQQGSIHLYLDRDKTGQRCTEQALSWSDRFKDRSGLYEGYNDLNEWMQQIGNSQRKGLRQS